MPTSNDKNQREICKDPVSVNQFIQRGHLKSLMEKAHLLENIKKHFMNALPEALRQYCQVANFRDDMLIVQVQSATHATLLRYRTPQLLAEINGAIKNIRIINIQFKIRPQNTTTPSAQFRNRTCVSIEGGE